MEEKSCSLQEAADYLKVSTQTVRNMLKNGWLASPVGRPAKGQSVRISEKSLYQLIVYDRVISLPPRTLRKLKNGRKSFQRFLSKIEEANRLSKIEGRSEAPDPSAPASRTAREATKQRLHDDFAVRRQFSFGWQARQLAPDDPALQDDLVQEMSLAVIEYDQPASAEFLYELATNRAKDYLKYEAVRGMLPLSAARHTSDKLAEQMKSLTTLIDDLLRSGVPSGWIEEVLGRRLDVA